ncbi:MAG: CCA tRNA nucleotidyltransferase [Clostridia bacterium]|nr:CCA tRNA nucleotidyltransferase [Clostridia bacterium]
MRIIIPENIISVMRLLEESGFEAYAVGGCVRDSLLGRRPYDWDVCTSALPEETLEVFKDFRTIPTGIKHGTVTVIADSPVEITTFRIDGEYLDNRRPSQVSFTRTLADDLCRRDFTVNAMAADKNGFVTDLYGGKEDLQKKIIRCVGCAQKRFDEDALRIMRALRFAATLGFELEESTARAVREQKSLLKNIAVERIRVETDKLLLGSCADILYGYREVFSVFIPEAEITRETAEKISLADKETEIRLALLLGNLTSENASAVLGRLRYSNIVTKRSVELIENKNKVIENTSSAVKRLLNAFGKENAERLVRFKRADGGLTPEAEKEILSEISRIIDDGECYSLAALAVSGSDLSAIGIKGKKTGETLNRLLNEVMEGTTANNKDDLLDKVK